MSPTDLSHVPVLLAETLSLLAPRLGETYVDLTIGRAGHATAVDLAIGPEGNVVGFDLDPANVSHPRDFPANDSQTKAVGRVTDQPSRSKWTLFHANFRSAPRLLREHNLRADMLLADLGFASTQMDDPNRGFSFREDGPLDMRLDTTQRLTAARLINETDERELARIIYAYGEEPLSRKIASRILAERKLAPILTTARLAALVQEAYGSRARFSRMHPATRTFMALRIAVNDELGNLESILGDIQQEAVRLARGSTAEFERGWLNPGCRIAFISFHSLEDRIVKHAMSALVAQGLAGRLTRKPVTAGDDEIGRNPRARSAKLRAVILGAGPSAKFPRRAENHEVGTYRT